MAGNDITVGEIESALRRENISLPSGSLEGGNLELSLALEKAYKDLDSLKKLPIKKSNNNVIRLENIAEVKFAPENEKVLFKVQGKNTNPDDKIVGIGLYAKRISASIVELSERIKKRIKKIEKNLPDGLSLNVSFDRSTYVKAAIFEIWKTLAIAFVLVTLIIFLFLGNIKSVIVPAVALPVSLIGTFIGLSDLRFIHQYFCSSFFYTWLLEL